MSASEDASPIDFRPESNVDIDEAFTRLRDLQAKLRGQTKRDQVTILIAAVIEEGVVHGRRIVGLVHHLGYDRRFVGMTLTKQAGDGDGCLWTKSGNAYRLHSHAAVNLRSASPEVKVVKR